MQGILNEKDRILRLGMFERLLGGLIYTGSEWNEIRVMFSDFPETWCLCHIRSNSGKDENSESIRSAVHLSVQMICGYYPAGFFMHYTGNDSAVIILPINNNCPEPESYNVSLAETTEQMRIKHQLHVSIAVSGIFGSLEQLSTAYRQTRQLLRIAGRRTGKNIFYMDDEDVNTEKFPLEFSDSQRFYELLLTCDNEHALLMIRHSFEQYLDRGYVQESVIYHLFWSFEQVFIRIRDENAADEDFNFTLPIYDPLNTIEELSEKILTAAAAICDYMEKNNNKQDVEFNAAIIAYIDSNVTDPMINLSSVSAAFGLSDRYIQAIIRKSTARSFFEYIDQKRMKMAYSLLTESNISVNDIAVKCGYALPNSFYKSFKRHFGFPPTDLRKSRGNS